MFDGAAGPKYVAAGPKYDAAGVPKTRLSQILFDGAAGPKYVAVGPKYDATGIPKIDFPKCCLMVRPDLSTLRPDLSTMQPRAKMPKTLHVEFDGSNKEG